MAIRSTFTTGEVLTAADLTDTIKGAFINTETTTARTLGTADAGNLVTLNNNSGGTVTIPTNTTWGSPLGTLVHLINIGTAGSFTVGTAAGVTLNAASATLAIQEGGTLIKTATNTWQFVKQSAPSANPGLAFITGTTFTTSSAVNVNNCFTATYENYRVLIRVSPSTTSYTMLRLRASGTDTTTNYSGTLIYNNNGNAPAGTTLGTGTIQVLGNSANNGSSAFDVMSPQASRNTFVVGQAYNHSGDSVSFFGSHGGTTQFDGLTIYPNTGTITGTLLVYGYRDS